MANKISESSWELYNQNNHACYLISLDRGEGAQGYIDTNQYLIIHNDIGILIDPGGFIFFDRILKEVSKFIEPTNIRYILLSHQDPDVSSSLLSWKRVTNAKFYISKLWLRFVSLYGLYDLSVIEAIDDSGGEIKIDEHFSILLIPAHFLHSPGNFSFYDTISNILFSGDIGASIIPSGIDLCGINDFDVHLKYMKTFHLRYMSGNRACKNWVKNVKKYEIDMIAPQHGAIFNKENSIKFLEWFDSLECGADLFI